MSLKGLFRTVYKGPAFLGCGGLGLSYWPFDFFLFWGVSQPFGHCEFQGDLYRGTSFLRHWGYLRDFLRGQNLGDWVFWVPFFSGVGMA